MTMELNKHAVQTDTTQRYDTQYHVHIIDLELASKYHFHEVKLKLPI